MTTTRERLGQARSELASARARITELEQRAAGPRVTLTAAARSLDRANNRVAELQAALDLAGREVAAKNRHIQDLDAQVSALGRRAADTGSLARRLNAAEGREAELRAELTRALARVRELEGGHQHLPGDRVGTALCEEHHAVGTDRPICSACHYTKVQQLDAKAVEMEVQRDRAREGSARLANKLSDARIRVEDALQLARNELQPS